MRSAAGASSFPGFAFSSPARRLSSWKTSAKEPCRSRDRVSNYRWSRPGAASALRVLELSCKELSPSEPKRPIFVRVRYESDDNIAWCDTAHSIQFLHQRIIERLLHRAAARAGRDLKDQYFRSSHDTETRILNDHSGWRMFSDDLISVVLGHVERFDQNLVGGAQYHIDL